MKILTNIAFVLLAVCWFLTRIIIFPYHCVLSGFIDFQELHPEKTFGRISANILCVLLCGLYILHLHWFYLILQVVFRTLSGKKIADPRSDQESDHSDVQHKAMNQSED